LSAGGLDIIGLESCPVANSDIKVTELVRRCSLLSFNTHCDVLQISSMVQRLDCWCKDVNSMELLLETKAHEFLTL
jgi:hypothetical protein